MTESKTGMSFSRRNFIKGAAALTATGALVGCAPAKETLAETGEEPVEVPETQIYAGACRAQCGQGCYLNVHVRDGRVVRTTAGHFDDGPEFDRICPKGLVQPARVYSAERLQYPMRRVGERGSGEFERISWDEALQEIADNIEDTQKQYGEGALAFLTASGNQAVAITSAYSRLASLLNASSIMPCLDMGSYYGMAAKPPGRMGTTTCTT